MSVLILAELGVSFEGEWPQKGSTFQRKRFNFQGEQEYEGKCGREQNVEELES